jgi:SAM-dependent methyltransferase
MKRLNLGCGGDILSGWVNLDIAKGKGVDVVHDLAKFPYPFPDNHFDEIRAYSILEHLPIALLIPAVEELQRILKPGGKLDIIVPHYTSPIAWSNPQHVRGFAYDTFHYFVKGYSGKETYTNRLFSSCRARLRFGKRIQVWNWLIEAIANLFPHLYENTPLHIFPAMGVRSVLTK